MVTSLRLGAGSLRAVETRAWRRGQSTSVAVAANLDGGGSREEDKERVQWDREGVGNTGRSLIWREGQHGSGLLVDLVAIREQGQRITGRSEDDGDAVRS